MALRAVLLPTTISRWVGSPLVPHLFRCQRRPCILLKRVFGALLRTEHTAHGLHALPL